MPPDPFPQDTQEQAVMYRPALKVASTEGSAPHQIHALAPLGGLIPIVLHPYVSKLVATVGIARFPALVRVQSNGRVMIVVFQYVSKLVETALIASHPTHVNVQQAGPDMTVVSRFVAKACLSLILQHTCMRRIDRGRGISTFRARSKSGVYRQMNLIASKRNVP